MFQDPDVVQGHSKNRTISSLSQSTTFITEALEDTQIKNEGEERNKLISLDPELV